MKDPSITCTRSQHSVVRPPPARWLLLLLLLPADHHSSQTDGVMTIVEHDYSTEATAPLLTQKG